MRKLMLFSIVLLTAAFGTASSGAPAKPGSHVPVPLVVTVHSLVDGINACRICGDSVPGDETYDGELGGTTYADGVDGVRAAIDQYGNLIVDFQTTRARMRGLVYDYSQPLDGQTASPSGNGSNHYLSTIRPPGSPALQEMLVGAEHSQPLASCPLYDDDSGQPQYRHSFNRDCQSGLGAEDSPLVVTRTSATTWNIAPDSSTGAAARVFGITTKGKVVVTDYGRFSMPFRMTLTAK